MSIAGRVSTPAQRDQAGQVQAAQVQWEGAVAWAGGTGAKMEVSSGAGGAGEHLCRQDRSRKEE